MPSRTPTRGRRNTARRPHSSASGPLGPERPSRPCSWSPPCPPSRTISCPAADRQCLEPGTATKRPCLRQAPLPDTPLRHPPSRCPIPRPVCKCPPSPARNRCSRRAARRRSPDQGSSRRPWLQTRPPARARSWTLGRSARPHRSLREPLLPVARIRATCPRAHTPRDQRRCGPHIFVGPRPIRRHALFHRKRPSLQHPGTRP
mmetsp:Transcript_18204/g.47359  ORF Transcript_18204/g.47359 Transcript_18204/m.47359 type:complete len:203 (+) Transcript_18204:1839-2447(+)